MPTALPRLYSDLATWWPLMSPVEDYADEAPVLADLIDHHASGPVDTVLELGSGGGHNAHYLRKPYEMTLVDLAPDMLAMSRAINPDCEHVEGDMRTVRLGRTFDSVLIHDAIMYMLTEADLHAAIATAAAHVREGGIVLLCPDCTRETFRESTCSGGQDAEDGRGFRYLEWVWDPDPTDTTFATDFAFLLREGSEQPRCVSERHVCGVFPEATWMAAVESAGLRPGHEGTFFLGIR